MELTHSIIIPYQHSEERYSIFNACLSSILSLSYKGFEVCIHEVGKKKVLSLPSKCKHLFTEYNGVFHRAWAINRGVKKLASCNNLILMDGDLIVNDQWANEIVNCKNQVSSGWSKLICLTEDESSIYKKTLTFPSNPEGKIKSPSKVGAAGGITLITKDIFNLINGIPEDFIGSWGGEDNALWAKLNSYGYKFTFIDSIIYHLYHSKSTPRVKRIQDKAISMIYWDKYQWEHHNKISNPYGAKIPSKFKEDTITKINNVKLTIAMLSWIRPEKLIRTLTSLDKTLTIPINLVLMVQGNETLNEEQRKIIKSLASRFYNSNVFFTNGNIGTGPARSHLLKRAMNIFDTPYINLGDDDTTYSEGSVEAAIELLENDLSIGIVGIRYKPTVYKLNNIISPTTINAIQATSSVEYVDSTGSASAFIRKEVFDLCSIDTRYKLGQWDLDLFLQARSIGWKIINYRAFAGMKAINDWGGSKAYRKGRMDRTKINRSIKLFNKKWGFIQ